MEFIAIFAVLVDNEIKFTNAQIEWYKYPSPDDSQELCKAVQEQEPLEFIDLVAVIDMDGNVVWEDNEDG